MHEVFRRAFREEIPGVRIGTGGNTVRHGKEKKDFNPRMYTELATEADVALWHAHGALDNYITLQRMVERWNRDGGRPIEQTLLGNSEAGLPSGSSPMGRLVQADNLVKKVGWAKSQANSYFYIWFTTTDTFDPQGGYLDGENWGLITYNQRLKPSGHAYNELIKRLANTTGRGEVSLDNRLQACAYTREDGTQVWLIWPHDRGARLMMRFAADKPVTVSNMFGRSRVIEPRDGLISWEGDGYPFYVEADAGVTFGRAQAPVFITYQDVVGLPPGAKLQLPITLRNTFDRDAKFNVTIQTAMGEALAQTSLQVARGATGETTIDYTMPRDTAYGSVGLALRVQSEPAELVDQTLPLTLVVAERAVRAKSFTIDGQPEKIDGAVPIVLNTDAAVQDLVSDPHTPNWAGPEDLSATATLAHDGKGIYLCFEVRDQSHHPGPAGAGMWAGDSVQAAFYAGDAHTEIGLTEADGGSGWVWISPQPDRANRKLDAPVAAKRNNGRTVYETYLTFESLGIAYESGLPVRFTFLVNEDDGRGRVRLLRWFDGIAADKSADRFGHVVLE